MKFMRYRISEKYLKVFISYFLIAVISVCINMTGYSKATYVLEQKLDENNQNVIQKIGVVVDNYFESVKKQSYSLLSSETVKRLALDSYSSYDRTHYVELLMDDMDFNSIKENYSVIIRNKDMCVQTGMGVCDIETAYKSTMSNYGSCEDWLNNLFGQKGARIETVEKKDGSIALNIIYYIPSLAKNIAVMAELDNAYLSKLISIKTTDNDSVYLMDDNGTLIAFSANAIKTTKHLIEEDEKIVKIDNVEYIKNEIKSSVDGLTYIKLTPYDYYLDDLKIIRRNFIFGFVACLFIGILFAAIFAKLSVYREKKHSLQLKHYQQKMQKEVLKKLILGKTDKTDGEYIDEITLEMNSGCYLLGLFDVFVSEEDIEVLDIDYIAKLYKWIETKINEHIIPIKMNYIIVDNMLVVIFGTDSDYTNNLKTAIENICFEAKDEFSINIKCILSHYVTELTHIYKLYRIVLENYSRLFVEKIPDNVVMCDGEKEFINEFLYNFDIEENLINLLRIGKAEDANKLVSSLFSQSSNLSFTSKKFLMAEIICTLVKVSENAVCSELYEEFSEYYSTSVYYKLKENIGKYINEICKSMKNEVNINNSVSKEKCREIKEYIENNYGNVSLNVNKLSYAFNVSRSWLSVNFKKTYNISISDYIVKCRIDAAKELLKTDMTITKIAEKVGFVNKDVYCRAFKKSEKITSSEYRNLIKKK